MSVDIQGNCLCGKIKVAGQAEHAHVHACHCGMCRRWGGGPFMSVQCAPDVKVEGESLGVFDSSEWAERGFCNLCGTHLFYRLKGGGPYFVSVELLSDSSQFSLEQQIFIDRKPAYYTLANDTQNLTEAEVFAQFQGS